MPVKKSSSPLPRRAAPRRSPRAPKPAASERIATPAPETYASGTLLSREEKRQIILAHAAARQPADRVQVTSMWLGVAACAAVVAVGWWWAVKPVISRSFDRGLGSAMAESSQTATELGKTLDGLAENRASGSLPDQAALQSRVERGLAETLSGQVAGSSTGAGRDIFSPSVAVTGTPAVTTQKPNDTNQP